VIDSNKTKNYVVFLRGLDICCDDDADDDDDDTDDEICGEISSTFDVGDESLEFNLIISFVVSNVE